MSQSGGEGSIVYFSQTIWCWLHVLNILHHALDLLRAKNTEVRYMSLYKTKAMYAASERQYTAAGGEVQVPRGGMYV